MELEIRNWKKYQHYKDRNPPWIKLHWELLTSMDWVTLDDASRVLAIACMLIASRNEGRIRADSLGLSYLERTAHLNAKPNLKPLIDCGFLVSASTMLAPCKQDAIPETYKEETEKEKPTRAKRVHIPKDFGITEATREWARLKGFEPFLESHLDYFRDYAESNAKVYADWDKAFRNCIRGDWGGIRKNNKQLKPVERRLVI